MAVRRNPDGTITVGIIIEKNESHKETVTEEVKVEAPVKKEPATKNTKEKKPTGRRASKKS